MIDVDVGVCNVFDGVVVADCHVVDDGVRNIHGWLPLLLLLSVFSVVMYMV